MTSMQVQVVGFDVLKELYEEDADFGEIWKLYADKPFNGFVRMDDFFFKGNTLCIPSCSLGLICTLSLWHNVVDTRPRFPKFWLMSPVPNLDPKSTPSDLSVYLKVPVQHPETNTGPCSLH